MFRSTFEFLPGERNGDFGIVKFKVVDVERRAELFYIGSPIGDDVPLRGKIYCLRIDGKAIPFSLLPYAPSAYIPSADLFKKQPFRRGKYPVVSVQVAQFGADLKAMKCGPRGYLRYQDVWPGSEYHGHYFSSNEERVHAFGLLQEALPVYLFGNYRSVADPSPAICRKVLPYSESDEYQNVDVTGLKEAENPALRAPGERAGTTDEYLGRLEMGSNRSPLTFEEVMFELLDSEREWLFNGVHLTSSIVQSERFWEVLRRSSEAFVSDNPQKFERWLLLVAGIVRDRQSARYVHEKQSAMFTP